MSDPASTPIQTNNSTISVPVIASDSASGLRTISIQATRLDTANQNVYTSFANHRKLRALRAQFGSILLKEARVECSTLALASNITNPEPIYFGLVPSSLNGMNNAVAVEYHGLKSIGLSSLELLTAHNDFLPPGVELQFGRMSLGAGHPEVCIASEGNMGNAAGGAVIDIASAKVFLTFDVSGVGPGEEFDV